ncbi:MAG: MFS transporter [Ilumatobacteraceae bacterium]
MAAATGEKGAVFRSLRHRNMRVYMFGLLLSNIGTWLQFTATSLLIYRINNRATDAGLNTLFQFLPMLLLGAWAGGFADRHDRRTVTLWTQTALGVQAAMLAVADFTGNISLPVVYALSLVLGVANAIDNPSRRGLVTELVEPHDIPNAMSLNTTVMTGSRIVGPAMAAVLIGPLGTSWLFLMNALSYVAVISSIVMLRREDMFTPEPAPRTPRPVREAMAFVWADAQLRWTFVVFAVVSTFAFNYSVVLPKLSDVEWGQANGYPILLTVVSIGSIAGAIATARFTRVSVGWYSALVALNGFACLALAVAPNFLFACLACLPLGVGGTGLVASMTAISQQKTSPEMRSRLLALQSVAFLGSTPIGGPITGWIGDNVGIRWSMAYGGIITLLVMPLLGKAK